MSHQSGNLMPGIELCSPGQKRRKREEEGRKERREKGTEKLKKGGRNLESADQQQSYEFRLCGNEQLTLPVSLRSLKCTLPL